MDFNSFSTFQAMTFVLLFLINAYLQKTKNWYMYCITPLSVTVCVFDYNFL